MSIDYTKFSPEGPKKNITQTDKQWWKLSQKDMANAINGIVDFLLKHQSGRLNQLTTSARLYGNLSVMGLNGLTYSRVAAAQSALKDRMTYNVVQSAIDTVTSKIAKNKPAPMFLTSGGNYKKQRAAKKLEKFANGILYQNRAYELGPIIFRDACVFGDGFTHVYSEHGVVKHERVLSHELFVDEIEGFYGAPRQLHRIKNIDRQVLIDCWPKARTQILQADAASPDTLGGYENIADVVTVKESWHLPSSPGAKDGARVISLINGTVDVYDWKRDYFPFARDQWSPRLFGYFGQGLAEQIQNIQMEINKRLWVAQRTWQLAGSFKVLLENGSKIVKEHLNNDIGAIITYSGTKPEYIVPPVLPPGFREELLDLINLAFQQAGVSQLSAASKKPDGLNSGKALREYNDIESDRFQVVGKGYEQYFMDLTRMSIDEAKELYEDGVKVKVKVPGKRFIEEIDWKEVDLEDDEYVMKCYPISSLPNDPAGRLQTVQEYAQAGYVDQETAKQLLDFPDLERVEGRSNAPLEYLEKILDQMVDDGIYTAPEPTDNLVRAKALVQQYIAEGKLNGLENEKLNLLRQFNEQLNFYSQMAQAAQAPGNAPQAVPEAPPVSDLIPNAPAQGGPVGG